METMQELIPFAKEMLSQKPSRKLLKLYLLGSVFAVLGTAIGLVETLCHPFYSGEPLDAEMLLMLASERRDIKTHAQPSQSVEEERRKEHEEEQEKELVQETTTKTKNPTPSKTYRLIQRSSANRLHAS